METFIGITNLTVAIWLIFYAFAVNATGMFYVVAFKALPFLLGLCCLFSAAKLWGWI